MALKALGKLRHDPLSREQRSACMAAIRSVDTKPELVVRKIVRALGVKCRLHGRDLPGSPDLVIDRSRIAIFVHGCFWHMHRCKRGRSTPATRVEFWRVKRTKNRDRDRRACSALRRAGWRVLVVWECELARSNARAAKLPARIENLLREKRPAH